LVGFWFGVGGVGCFAFGPFVLGGVVDAVWFFTFWFVGVSCRGRLIVRVVIPDLGWGVRFRGRYLGIDCRNLGFGRGRILGLGGSFLGLQEVVF